MRPSLPQEFSSRKVRVDGAELFVQFVQGSGSGPAVVLLHGNPQNGNAWGPLAAALAEHHTVVVPIFGASADLHARSMDTRRRRRPRTWPRCSMPWPWIARCWWGTTSAGWLLMHSQRDIQ